MKLHKIIVCAIVVSSLPLFSKTIQAQGMDADAIIHVEEKDGVANPPNFGRDGWNQNAHRFLQEALDDAQILIDTFDAIDSVEIWVASGTYFPDEDANNPNGSDDDEVSFEMHNDVYIRGGFVGDEQNLGEWNPEAADPTILSGDIVHNC